MQPVDLLSSESSPILDAYLNDGADTSPEIAEQVGYVITSRREQCDCSKVDRFSCELKALYAILESTA
jgi:hypothetical protein